MISCKMDVLMIYLLQKHDICQIYLKFLKINLRYNFKTKNKMKKILLVAGIVLMSLSAKAQDKGLQGTWWVGGQVSFDSQKTGTVEKSSNMFLPIVGYFIAPSTTIGVGIGTIGSKEVNGAGTTTSDASTFVIKPLVRKYWNVKGGLFFFGQAALPIMMGKESVADSKTSTFGLELSPGFDYVVNSWMTVETSFKILNFTSSTATPAVGEKTTTTSFSANPMNSVADRTLGGLQLGVKFLF
jgi:hypothetical protein